jgi:hypothetical protein
MAIRRLKKIPVKEYKTIGGNKINVSEAISLTKSEKRSKKAQKNALPRVVLVHYRLPSGRYNFKITDPLLMNKVIEELRAVGMTEVHCIFEDLVNEHLKDIKNT